MQCLELFAATAGLVLQHTVLELADQWASRRRSWWAVLSLAGTEQFQLRPWPALATPTKVQDVIPEWPAWPKAIEAALLWDAKERETIEDPAFASASHVLVASDPAPPALHSWGCTFRPCPCGCRPYAISQACLKPEHRGPGVPSTVVDGLRYLHPAEVGLLNSLPPLFHHHPDPRTALCLVGQLAAPLQALWIWAQVFSSIPPCFRLKPIDPLTELDKFKQLLLQQRQDHWLLPSMCAAGQLSLQDAHGQRYERASGPVTAGQLICAETAFLPPGFKVHVSVNGRVLPRSAHLAFQPEGPTYHLHVQRKAAALDLQPIAQSPSSNATPRGGSPASVAPPLPVCTTQPESTSSPQSPLDALCSVGASDFTIWYGILQWVQCPAARTDTCLAPPCAAETLLQLLSEDLLIQTAGSFLPQGPLVLVPFVSQGHWSLLSLRVAPAGVEAELWDGIPGRNLATARLLVRTLCRIDGAALLSLTEHTHWLQRDPTSCGAHVIAHAAALIMQDASNTLLDWALIFSACFSVPPGFPARSWWVDSRAGKGPGPFCSMTKGFLLRLSPPGFKLQLPRLALAQLLRLFCRKIPGRR